MKEWGFSYTWADMKPVRALAVVLVVEQILGALIGLAFPQFNGLFVSAWYGAAVAAFPAFLLGMFIQSRLSPGSIQANSLMVRRLGLIGLALTAMAVALPYLGWTRAA